MCEIYIASKNLSISHIAEKARTFVTVTPLSQIVRKKRTDFVPPTPGTLGGDYGQE